MIDMARKEILPAVSRYLKTLSETVVSMKAATVHATTTFETDLIDTLSSLNAEAYSKLKTLARVTADARTIRDYTARSHFYKDIVIPAMTALRSLCDEMESMTAEDMWPIPSSGDLLFGVR